MILAVGIGIYGFGFIVTADVALTYLTDCYPDVCTFATTYTMSNTNGF